VGVFVKLYSIVMPGTKPTHHPDRLGATSRPSSPTYLQADSPNPIHSPSPVLRTQIAVHTHTATRVLNASKHTVGDQLQPGQPLGNL
jgi:hypothetical protein